MNAIFEIIIAGVIVLAIVPPLAHFINKWKKEMDESE
jgi:low affinity Fe/Cu permease